MNNPLDDERLVDMSKDERVVAFDMLLRGALYPHISCGCGLGPSAVTAVTMNVLGSLGFEAGLTPEGLEAEGFWEQMKLNFKAGYAQAAQTATEGVTVQ